MFRLYPTANIKCCPYLFRKISIITIYRPEERGQKIRSRVWTWTERRKKNLRKISDQGTEPVSEKQKGLRKEIIMGKSSSSNGVFIILREFLLKLKKLRNMYHFLKTSSKDCTFKQWVCTAIAANSLMYVRPTWIKTSTFSTVHLPSILKNLQCSISYVSFSEENVSLLFNIFWFIGPQKLLLCSGPYFQRIIQLHQQ